jgi:hypothetical protein
MPWSFAQLCWGLDALELLLIFVGGLMPWSLFTLKYVGGLMPCIGTTCICIVKMFKMI